VNELLRVRSLHREEKSARNFFHGGSKKQAAEEGSQTGTFPEWTDSRERKRKKVLKERVSGAFGVKMEKSIREPQPNVGWAKCAMNVRKGSSTRTVEIGKEYIAEKVGRGRLEASSVLDLHKMKGMTSWWGGWSGGDGCGKEVTRSFPLRLKVLYKGPRMRQGGKVSCTQSEKGLLNRRGNVKGGLCSEKRADVLGALRCRRQQKCKVTYPHVK